MVSISDLTVLVLSRLIKISVAPTTTTAITEGEEETTPITLTHHDHDGTSFLTATTDATYSKVPFCSQSLITWEYQGHLRGPQENNARLTVSSQQQNLMNRL